MIDNKGRIKGRVSLIDIILALTVIVLVVGFVHTNFSERIQDVINPSTPFHVVIQGDRVRHFIVDAVEVGDVMFRNHDRQALGTVIAVDVEQAQDILHKADGTAVLVDHEHRYNVIITLEAVGTARSSIGYFINGNDHIAPGSEIALHSNRVFIPNGRVQSVTRMGE